MGPGNSVWPETFAPLPADHSLPPCLFLITGAPHHGAEAAPWVHSAREHLHAALPRAQRTLLDRAPHLPHLGQGDVQQSPSGPWAEGHPVAAAGDRPPGGHYLRVRGEGPQGLKAAGGKAGRERQHMVKGSNDRLGSHSSSFSPHYSPIAAAR